MAFDLMFTHKNLAYSEARDPDFRPDSKELKARSKILKELATEFHLPAQDALSNALPENAGKVLFLEGFPLGELYAHSGYLHWSLHGNVSQQDRQKIVDWFYSKSWLCTDPQNAGFDNHEPSKVSSKPTSLDNTDILIGANLRAIELSDPGLQGIIFQWTLADGREAELMFIHHDSCSVPTDITSLIKDKIVAVDITEFPRQIAGVWLIDDDYEFKFASGAVIRCEKAIMHRFTARPAPASKW